MGLANLILARATYAGASLLASRMWTAVKDLNDVELTLSADIVLEEIANGIYYGGYTVSETYDTVEEFKESLDINMSRGFERNGDVFHIRPFFSGGELMREVGFGYLTGYLKMDELSALNVTVPTSDYFSSDRVTLSAYEESILVKHYFRESITLINVMRDLRVSMNYITKGLINAYNTAPSYEKASKNSAMIDSLVATLVKGTTIEGLAEVPSGFSSENKHKIRLLPRETMIALSKIE